METESLIRNRTKISEETTRMLEMTAFSNWRMKRVALHIAHTEYTNILKHIIYLFNPHIVLI